MTSTRPAANFEPTSRSTDYAYQGDDRPQASSRSPLTSATPLSPVRLDTMNDIRWFNPSQPDTLRNAVILGYMAAVFTILDLGRLSAISNVPLVVMFLAAAGAAAGSVGCASEKKWGYGASIGAAAIIVLARGIVVIKAGGITLSMIGLMFTASWLYLLLHERTKDYQRIWFK